MICDERIKTVISVVRKNKGCGKKYLDMFHSYIHHCHEIFPNIILNTGKELIKV